MPRNRFLDKVTRQLFSCRMIFFLAVRNMFLFFLQQETFFLLQEKKSCAKKLKSCGKNKIVLMYVSRK